MYESVTRPRELEKKNQLDDSEDVYFAVGGSYIEGTRRSPSLQNILEFTCQVPILVLVNENNFYEKDWKFKRMRNLKIIVFILVYIFMIGVSVLFKFKN